MKFKFLSLLVVLALLMGLGFVKPVQAAGYGTSFLTSITYMNVGTADAAISVDFYQEGSATVTKSYPVASLKPGAAASLSVGSVFTTAFKGSAVMSSDQPLVATMVQVPASTAAAKNRPLSNGFSAGSTSVLIPTVLKNKFNTNTIFTVQNAGSAAANVTVNFIPATDGTAFTHTINNLAPGAAQYIDMGTFTSAGSIFNGSVRITSAQPMVATAMELGLVVNTVYAFEGVGTASASNTQYMPSALCAFGPTVVSSAFAIQNTSTTDSTAVTVNYVGTANGTPVNKTINLGTLAPGAKVSSSGCGVAGNTIPAGFLGAATINAPGAPVVAVAKVFNSGNYSAAHNGASSGALKLAAPYVRWSNKFYKSTTTPVQQTNIAVQNIGNASIAANTIKVHFIGADGTVKGTYTYPNALAVGAKFSVNPVNAGLTEFGYVADPVTGNPKSFGGGAQIVGPAGSQLAAVVRINTNATGGEVAEDYNAIPMP